LARRSPRTVGLGELLEAAAPVQQVDGAAEEALVPDGFPPAPLVKDRGGQVPPGLAEDPELLLAGFRKGVGAICLFAKGQVGGQLQVEVVHVGEGHAVSEPLFPEPRQAQVLRQRHQEAFQADGHLLPEDLHLLGDGGDGGLAHGLHLPDDGGVASVELPALQVGEVGDDVVGEGVGVAHDNVKGHDQGDLVGVQHGPDLLVAPGEGVGGVPHVVEEDLDGIGVALGRGGEDFLVDVGGVGVPGPLGGVAREEGGLLVLDVVADEADAEGRLGAWGGAWPEGRGRPPGRPVMS
jgi:hypothetical protein